MGGRNESKVLICTHNAIFRSLKVLKLCLQNRQVHCKQAKLMMLNGKQCNPNNFLMTSLLHKKKKEKKRKEKENEKEREKKQKRK